MYRIIPGSQLLILPGKHGEYIGAVEYLENKKWSQQYIIDIINEFLESSAN